MSDLFIDPVALAAGDTVFRIAVDEVPAFLLHHIALLLAHRTSEQIRPAQCVSCQTLHDLHDLLLIDDAPVGRAQNRFQLRRIVLNLLRILLPRNILRNEIHRSRAVKRNTCNNIIDTARLKLFHKARHPGRFQLEDAGCIACAEHVVNSGIIQLHCIHINHPAAVRICDDPCACRRIASVCHARQIGIILSRHAGRILNNGQGLKPQEIHFEKAQLLQRCHRELRDRRAVRAERQRYILLNRLLADHDTCRMHRHMSGKPLKAPAHIDQFADLLVIFIELSELRVDSQRAVQRDAELRRDHLCDLIAHRIGQIHHTADIADYAACQQCSESTDLRYLCTPVFRHNIINHFLAPHITEINVNIRHRHAFRV